MNNNNRWQPLLSSGYFASLVLWLLVTIFPLAGRYETGELFFFGGKDSVYISDFSQFYIAGQITRSPSRFQVYDPKIQLEWTNKLIKPLHTDKMFFLQWVPFAFALFALLPLLSIKMAYLAWCLVTMAVAILGMVLILKELYGLKIQTILLFVLGTLASVIGWSNIVLGQIGWLLVGLISVFLWALLRQRDVLAGVMLAMTTIKPQYAFFVAIPAFVGKRWKILAAALVTEIVFLAISGCIIGGINVWNYPLIILHTYSIAGHAGVNANMMASVRGILSFLFSQSIAFYTSMILYVAGIGLVSWLWIIAARRSMQQTYLAIALTILASLLLSPHEHLHDCLLLVIPAMFTLPMAKSFEDLIALKSNCSFQSFWNCLFILYPFLSWLMLIIMPGQRVLFALVNFSLALCGFCMFKQSLKT